MIKKLSKINLIACLTLLSGLLLVACGDTIVSTEVSQPTTAVNSSSTIAPLPTATVLPIPAIANSTLAPLPTTTALPAATATPTVAPEVQEQEVPPQPIAQLTPQPSLEQLPRLNGVPKIPVLNPTPGTNLQPAPVLKANYGPNNTPLIGLQIGHFQTELLPDEQASLRGQTGGSGGGVREVDLNQDIVRRTAALLQTKGYTVEILPATVPIGYTADLFVAVHADAVASSGPNGFKMARSRFSAIPETDDRLVELLYATYGKATGLGISDSITRNMTGYYAFNNRRRQHAISKVTPAIIIETGYLTSPVDRAVLLNRTDSVAKGIADGITQFIESRPPLEQREKPVTRVPAIVASLDNTPVYGENGGIIAYVSKGQLFEYYESRGDNYSIFVPVLRLPGFIRKADATTTNVQR